MTKTKIIICLMFVVVFVFSMSSCCSHVWEDATCNSPKTCMECGLTQGEPEHAYGSADCLEKRICEICGKTAEPMGHQWDEATCIYPKACSACEAVEGAPLGHTTKKGKCSRCNKKIDELNYKNGYAIVNYNDTEWMRNEDDFIDICIAGRIISVGEYNDLVIKDETGGIWTAHVGTACDLSSYEGTTCEVYGFSTGGTSSQHDTPLINMSRDENYIVFSDGKTLYPQDYASNQQFKDKFNTQSNVWISENGGKYHSSSTCSNMKDATKVTLSQAKASGYTACDKCN